MAVTLQTMDHHHLEHCFALTQQLKWPHRLADWQQALRLGEGIVACQGNEVIGTVLLWRWGSSQATIGLVIVSEAAQGRGIGKQLMLAALEKLSDYQIRLNATVAGKSLYEKLGFIRVGNLEQRQCPQLGPVQALPSLDDRRLRQALPGEAEQLAALDRQAHGLYRPQLITELLTRAQRVLLLEQAGNILGFAALRRFGHGWVVGPVIARHVDDAKRLISQILSELSGQFVRIDTDAASGLSDWLDTLGLTHVDTSGIMVRGTRWQPAADGMQAFGLMTQAMG